MPRYLGVTYLTEAQFNSPTAAMLTSAAVFAVNGDSSVLYVSNGARLVAMSGDPAPELVGNLVLGGTVRVVLADGWMASNVQIYRNGIEIPDATDTTYVLKAADVVPGTKLSVEASGFIRMSRVRTVPVN